MTWITEILTNRWVDIALVIGGSALAGLLSTRE